MLVIALMLGSKAVWAQAPSDVVVQQLRDQGYTGFKVSRTLLGRVRVLAWTPDGERRELVFNPRSGEILRDYVTADHTRASASIAPVPRVLDRPDDDPPILASGEGDLNEDSAIGDLTSVDEGPGDVEQSPDNSSNGGAGNNGSDDAEDQTSGDRGGQSSNHKGDSQDEASGGPH
jgi:hypothetical protein